MNTTHLNPELIPQRLRELRVDTRSHLKDQPCLSAVSGLVRVKGRLFVPVAKLFQLAVIGDDIVAAHESGSPITVSKLFEGEVPGAKGKRRLAKPDLDTLTTLPAIPGCPYGALLALPSGVNLKNDTALLIVLDAQGMITERLAYIDMAPLYEPLRQRFDDLNIEGAFFASGELRFLHRGNRGDARNVCICFDISKIGPWLTGQSLLPPSVKAVHQIALGSLAGLPLGLTDGAALPGGAWAFSAVAVNARNTPQAGACVGSVVGIIGPDGSVRQMEPLHGAPNVQGIVAQVGEGRDEGEIVLTLAAAAVETEQAAELLQVRLIAI